MAEFLLELLSEDIPARMQVQAAEDLKRSVTKWLDSFGLAFSSAVAHSTPRRLTLVIDGLPEKSPDRTEERKGPKVGAPEGAIQGFLKSSGLVSIDQAVIRETDKGAAYFSVRVIAGEPTVKLLRNATFFAMLELSWPKSMRWGNSPQRWVRPLHQLVMLFNQEFNLGPIEAESPVDVVAKDTTLGHRFLAPERFNFRDFSEYERKLLEHYVVLDREKRKWRIQGDAKRVAEAHGLVVVPDEALLEEVVGLVEWPVVLMGSIDNNFMDLPPEVRRTTMRANQKYFTLEQSDGKPAARFILVANMVTDDGGDAVVAGNERVLRARLSDARFFYDQDRKTPLRDLRPKLAKIAFHAKLGTVLDRVERLEKLVLEIARYVPRAEPAMAVEAARLCKCDLVTGMVGEFPELQGLMGRYYALDEGAPSHVAEAISDHYKPLGPNDACPTAPVSVVLALAEKIDTLVGFFAIGETPTGSKDPFALRRAALGVIRLIVENGLRLPLESIILNAVTLIARDIAKLTADIERLDQRIEDVLNYQETVENKINQKKLKKFLSSDFPYKKDIFGTVAELSQGIQKLLPFFADRLKVVLKERGVRHDLVDAVFALGGEDDLVRLLARVQALQDFLATDDGANLLAAYKRAANILKIEEKRDGVSYEGQADPDLLSLPEERAFADALSSAGATVDPLIEQENFQAAMAKYAELRPAVDAFFDRVKVNDDDPKVRANRLRLLSRMRSTLNKIADFSRIN